MSLPPIKAWPLVRDPLGASVSPSPRLGAEPLALCAPSSVMLPLRGDEIVRLLRLLQKSVHLRLDQFVGLRLAGAAVFELEQRVDVRGLNEPAGVLGILVDVPGISAIAHALVADLLHQGE